MPNSASSMRSIPMQGVMLGFAGALAALAPTDTNLVVDVGKGLRRDRGDRRSVGLLGRVRAEVPALRSLREGYLSADPRFTRRTLLDSYLVNIDELSDALRRKVRRIKMAMSGIIASALLVAVGSAVD